MATKWFIIFEYEGSPPTYSENAIDFDGKERQATGDQAFDTIMGLRVNANIFDVVTESGKRCS